MLEKDIVFAITIVTLLILLLIAIIFIVFIVSGRKTAQQRTELAETKLAFEKELRQVEIEVSEQVMGHFAQELHDNIGQLLTAMHIHLENQKMDHPARAKEYAPLEIYLDEVRQQLRLLSRTLNNDYLGNIGLLSAIALEVERLNTLKRHKTHYDAPNVPLGLSKNQELMVFRIFQELTQNILRHAKAQNVWIKIQNNKMPFELIVKDDGQGFDLTLVLESNKASGIRNIMKRSKLAGFTCEIKTALGEGTEYIIKTNNRNDS